MTTRLSLSLFIAAACAAAQTGKAVEGRVLSTVQNQPIAKAIVTLRADIARAGRAGVASNAVPGAARGPVADVWVCESNSDGRYRFVNIPPGNYTIRATRNGFLAQPPGRYATAADFPPVKVVAGQNVSGIDMHLTPSAAVSGRVLDNDGDPVRGNVQLMRYGWQQGTKKLQMADNGEINDRGDRIYNVAPGSYYLRAMPDDGRQMGMRIVRAGGSQGPMTGLSSAYYPSGVDVARATELYLSPGVDLKNIDVRVEPITLHSIRGSYPFSPDSNVQIHAVNKNGEEGNWNMFGNVFNANLIMNGSVAMAVNGAVRLAMAQNGQRSAAPGMFEIDNLPPGSYTVLATAYKNAAGRGAPEITQYARENVDVLDRDVDGVVLNFTPPIGPRRRASIRWRSPQGQRRPHLPHVRRTRHGRRPIPPQARWNPRVDARARRVSRPLRQHPNRVHPVPQNRRQGNRRSHPRHRRDRRPGQNRSQHPLRLRRRHSHRRRQQARLQRQRHPHPRSKTGRLDPTGSAIFSPTPAATTSSPPSSPATTASTPGWRIKNGAPQSAEFRKPYESQAAEAKIAAGDARTVDLKAIK